MVDIQPFCALRFQPKKVADLARVLCPPYDVISSEGRQQIAHLHPYNAVHLELPKGAGGRTRYQQAAALLRRWQRLGVLGTDSTPAMYLYQQTFSLDGKAFNRVGFFCALKVERPWVGGVAPHERTLPRPKADRLRLFRAVKADISPIFGVAADPRASLAQYLRQLIRHQPDGQRLLLDVGDPLDRVVRHRLWRVTGEEEIATLQQFLRFSSPPPGVAKPVMIADGHHRYETAWAYAQECAHQARRMKGARWIAASSAPPAFHYVLAFLCSIADPGVVILPTHRALAEDPWGGRWPVSVQRAATITPMASMAALKAAIERISPWIPWIGVFRCRRDREQWHLLTASRSGPSALRAKASPSGRQELEVVWLHEGLLRNRIPPDRFRYSRDAAALVRETRTRGRGVVFMLPPPRKDLIMHIATSGVPQCLPPKSTYFYPKLATGLVMLSLDGPLHPS